MGKYSNLTTWLKSAKTLVLTFDEIEAILEGELPKSALKYRVWWGNETGAESRHCRAWLGAGYEVDEVKLKDRIVRFRKA